MSKRFGRNQKRKMRADLEAYKEALKRETELARYLRRKGARDAEAVRRVAEVLGRHFIALDPPVVEMSYLAERLRLSSMPGTLDSTFCRPDGPPVQDMVELAVTELEAAWFDLRGDQLTGQAHARVRGPGPLDVGYAISRPALYSAPAAWIAESVAHDMRGFLEQAVEKEQRS